jgi:hypothetical protein
MDASLSQNADVLQAARERVRIEAPPAWVTPGAYWAGFKPATAAPVTHLLIEQLVHAELHQTFFRKVMRLETVQAVQQASQWRLEFEPRTQSVLIHTVRIRRGKQDFDHADLTKLHFLEREAGRERFIVDGWCTLLLPLDDVRPGDVLEWSYTLTDESPVLPGRCSSLFHLPTGTHLGKYVFAVRFAGSRPMRWKTSTPQIPPRETRKDGEVNWVWTCENCQCPEPEEFTPEWFSTAPWIQVSDCPDWKTVASAFACTWLEDAPDAVEELAREIERREGDTLGRITRAVELVQDEFRCLSVNLEPARQLPTQPGTVIRRRYGDCKDLSLLLVRLLKRLGVSARPILVNTVLQKTLADFLPAPGLFNHVLVEFEYQSEKRRVDATVKLQGGDALNRVTPDFGPGLPVDHHAADLVSPPGTSVPPGSYELKESILLDTAGGWSNLDVTVTAKGMYADMLRQEFQNEGVAGLEKKRLHLCIERYVNARRTSPLQHRDDRARNEFVYAESYEIKGFLAPDATPEFCLLPVPCDTVLNILKLPPPSPRRAPFALAYPCRVAQIVEVLSPALQQDALPPGWLHNDFFKFDRFYRSASGCVVVAFSLTTLTDAVSPGQIAEYRKAVEYVRWQAIGKLRLPGGHPRPRTRDDARQATLFDSQPATNQAPPRPRSPESATAGSPLTEAGKPAMPLRGNAPTATGELGTESVAKGNDAASDARHTPGTWVHRYHRWHHSDYNPKREEWIWIVGAAFIIILAAVGVYFLAKTTGPVP